MSMNRFVGLGVFALISSAFLGLACDDSTTPPVTSSPGAGGAQNTTKKTSAVENGGDDGGGDDEGTGGTSAKKTSATKASTAKGGSSSSSAKKTTTAAKPEGGAGGEDTEPEPATGGKSGGGGAVSTAECEMGTTNLLTDAAKSEEFNWVGGDNTTDADDPCGFQGAFYAYSDKGADEVAGNADDSLQKPAFVSGTEYASPCVEGKCCIEGTTSLWPEKEVYTTWGAGLGFSLSDAGEGGGKRPYSGAAKGLKIMLEGEIKKQVIRIGLTQSETDESAPFVSTTTLGEKTVMFDAPTCPSWATACIDPTPTPYDLQIQVAGGDAGADGPFKVCVTSIIPIESE